MVDDNEVLFLLLGVDGLVTHKVLQLDNLLALSIRETALRLDKFFPLFCGRVEEAGVDLTKPSLAGHLWRQKEEAHVFSYSKLTLRVKMKAFSTRFGMSGCRAP